MDKIKTWADRHQTTTALCIILLCVAVAYVIFPSREAVLAPDIINNTFNVSMTERDVTCVEENSVHAISANDEVLLERKCNVHLSFASLNCTSRAYDMTATYEHGMYALSGTCAYQAYTHAWAEYVSLWVVFAWMRLLACILLLIAADLALFVFVVTSCIWCRKRDRPERFG